MEATSTRGATPYRAEPQSVRRLQADFTSPQVLKIVRLCRSSSLEINCSGERNPESSLQIEHKELLPYYSPKIVGQMLGRSEDAIKIIRQRQHIKAGSKSEGWFTTANRVMQVLGMPDARPVIGWVKKGLVLGHRIAGDDTWMVHEISLAAGLSPLDPGSTSIRLLLTKPSEWR